jgi:nucleotide-binding universal stress UspA family protein
MSRALSKVIENSSFRGGKTMKVLVAYDGTLQAKDALRHGLDQIRERGGRLTVLHVFNNRMFIDYDATAGAEQTARTESSRMVEEAKRIIETDGEGLSADIVMGEGNPEEEVIEYAKAHHMDVLLCSPRYRAIRKKMGAGTGKDNVSVLPGKEMAFISLQ